MTEKVFITANRYVDSITLMDIREKASRLEGVEFVEVQMGTAINVGIMKNAMRFDVPNSATEYDLVVCVRASDEEAADKCSGYVTELLNSKANGSGRKYTNLDEIDFEATGYNLVQISIPGEYVVEETKKAIDHGCNVYIFSADVSLEDELEIKKYGRDHGKLVMGPDCGVAQIGGVCLGAGSIVRKGPVGIVGASGSGSQEVACIVERLGYGVTDIIGTGGRDLSKTVGGTAMIEGIKRYEADPDTEVICCVSMLADRDVMNKVLTFADGCTKPVVAVFLGSDEKLFEGHRVIGAVSLEDAANKTVELLSGEKKIQGYSDEELIRIAKEELAKYTPEQKVVRAYFLGGTFAEETLVYLCTHTGEEYWSNRNNRYCRHLPDCFESKDNCVLDLGDTDIIANSVHPVFDNTIRNVRIKKDLADRSIAAVVLDFIGGPALDLSPFEKTVEICKKLEAEAGHHITFICHMVGSYADPQDFPEYTDFLRENGFIVTGSNIQSAKLLGMIADGLNS